MGTANEIGGSVRRGTTLLIDHCSRLDRLTGGSRRPARPGQERLEGLIGPDLAGGLVRALSGDHRLARPRWADGIGEAF
jgi:hypothetical protein